MNQVIGILGGMGPRATVKFEQMLLDKLVGPDQALPKIITINDGSIPDRTQFLKGVGEDPLPKMVRNVGLLEKMGSDIICIPCNTACAPVIFNRIQSCTEIPIINLPAEVGKVLNNRGVSELLLLATEGTIAAGTFQIICQNNGIKCRVPSDCNQQLINSLIYAIKNGDKALAKLLAKQIKELIIQSNIKTIVMGCTEIPLVADLLVPESCAAIDTLEVLVDVAISMTKCNNSIKENVNNATR